MKRTPLHGIHLQLGARLVEFNGWELPVQYTSILEEHQAVRNAAGLFDISHMGEFKVRGRATAEFLNHMLTNDLGKLKVGQGQYTLMCNRQGGVIDDLYAYRIGASDYLLIVNAGRIERDAAWLEDELKSFRQAEGVELANASDEYGAVALQGPHSPRFIDAYFAPSAGPGEPGKPASELQKNEIGVFSLGGAKVLVARSGYTGEDGYEIFAPSAVIGAVWEKLMEAGKPHGLKPAGLGARDTLRTEVCYPLYGHELDEETTPIEAGLGFFVAMDKPEFIGREVLARQKTEGVRKKCVAFKMTRTSSPPPRPHYPIWSSESVNQPVGEVVSGTQSLSLGIGIGLGYLPPELARAGASIEIEIRGQRFPAQIVPKPIFRKSEQKL